MGSLLVDGGALRVVPAGSRDMVTGTPEPGLPLSSPMPASASGADVHAWAALQARAVALVLPGSVWLLGVYDLAGTAGEGANSDATALAADVAGKDAVVVERKGTGLRVVRADDGGAVEAGVRDGVCQGMVVLGERFGASEWARAGMVWRKRCKAPGRLFRTMTMP